MEFCFAFCTFTSCYLFVATDKSLKKKLTKTNILKYIKILNQYATILNQYVTNFGLDKVN